MWGSIRSRWPYTTDPAVFCAGDSAIGYRLSAISRLFTLLGVEAAVGRTFREESDAPPVIVLGHRFFRPRSAAEWQDGDHNRRCPCVLPVVSVNDTAREQLMLGAVPERIASGCAFELFRGVDGMRTRTSRSAVDSTSPIRCSSRPSRLVILGGHLKTGQLGSPQNRPVRRPSSRTRISFTLSVAVLASLSASVVPGSSLPLPASGGEL